MQMNIGLAIKKIRKTQSISQKELAESCGITPTFMCLIENGKKEISMKTLKLSLKN